MPRTPTKHAQNTSTIATMDRMAYVDGLKKRSQESFDVCIKTQTVSFVMFSPYAAELLRHLRNTGTPTKGQSMQISIDCPVDIVIDRKALKQLITALESIVESPDASV